MNPRCVLCVGDAVGVCLECDQPVCAIHEALAEHDCASACGTWRERVKHITRQRDDARRELAEARADAFAMSAEIERQRMRAEAAEAGVAALNEKLAEASRLRRTAMAQSGYASWLLRAAEAERDRLKADNAELEAALKGAQEAHAATTDAYNALAGERDRLRGFVQGFVALADRMHNEFDQGDWRAVLHLVTDNVAAARAALAGSAPATTQPSLVCAKCNHTARVCAHQFAEISGLARERTKWTRDNETAPPPIRMDAPGGPTCGRHGRPSEYESGECERCRYENNDAHIETAPPPSGDHAPRAPDLAIGYGAGDVGGTPPATSPPASAGDNSGDDDA